MSLLNTDALQKKKPSDNEYFHIFFIMMIQQLLND